MRDKGRWKTQETEEGQEWKNDLREMRDIKERLEAEGETGEEKLENGELEKEEKHWGDVVEKHWEKAYLEEVANSEKRDHSQSGSTVCLS